METAKRQMLRDPGVEPTDEVIAMALGEANDAYMKFISLPLDNEVKRMAAEGERMGNRLRYLPLVFDLRSDELFPSVFALADFKKSLR